MPGYLVSDAALASLEPCHDAEHQAGVPEPGQHHWDVVDPQTGKVKALFQHVNQIWFVTNLDGGWVYFGTDVSEVEPDGAGGWRWKPSG